MIASEKPAVLFAPHVETSTGILLPDEYIKRASAAVAREGGLSVPNPKPKPNPQPKPIPSLKPVPTPKPSPNQAASSCSTASPRATSGPTWRRPAWTF